MRLLTSITEIIIFSLFIILLGGLISCSKIGLEIEKKEALTEEEQGMKKLESANIKPLFIEEAKFYSSTNKTRQITKMPEETEEEKPELLDFPETYDPFSIIKGDDNSGIVVNWNIYFTHDFDKDNAQWQALSDYGDSTYIHYKQSRFNGKIPKWFRVDIHVTAGGTKKFYINTLKQKKDVYIFITGSTLFNHEVLSANIAKESCIDPSIRNLSAADKKKREEADKKAQEEAEKNKKEVAATKKTEEDEKKKRCAADNSADECKEKEHNEHDDIKKIKSDIKNYAINDAEWNKCIKMEMDQLIYSKESLNIRALPGKTVDNPMQETKESRGKRHTYNI